MQNGVSSDVYEGKIQGKKCKKERGRKEGKGRGKKGEKGRKEKNMRDSLDPGGSGLSHFEGDFLKF